MTILSYFLDQAKTYKRVPMVKEIAVADLDVVSLFQYIKNHFPDAVLLENLNPQDKTQHHSLIAFESMADFKSKKNQCTQTIGQNVNHIQSPPFIALREFITKMSCAPSAEDDFNASIIGFMSYDAVRLFENIPSPHPLNECPELTFYFYRQTLRFDHQRQTLLFTYIVDARINPKQQYQKTCLKMTALLDKVCTYSSLPKNDILMPSIDLPFVYADECDEVFKEKIARAKQYIRAGDAFQIVLSRTFKTPYSASPLDIYRILRQQSPTSYLFYFPFHNDIVIGASVEKLVSVQHSIVNVNPIAGTRKRDGKTFDEVLAQELLDDEKELAEHMMLVDLARNDVGAICAPGSVHVPELLNIKHYSHVSHITSIVAGKLRDPFDALDALAATFPAGTLSGAPKIRAMEIIDELESTPRGLYGGSICQLDYQGNLDSCIAFRMAVLQNGIASIRAGAGIVFDSDAQAEAHETRQKAQSMLNAIHLAQASTS